MAMSSKARKIGITMDPANRIHGVCSTSPVEEDVEYTAVYTCMVSPRIVEADYHDQLSSRRLDNEEEWFGISTKDAVEEMERFELAPEFLKQL